MAAAMDGLSETVGEVDDSSKTFVVIRPVDSEQSIQDDVCRG